MQFPIKWLNGKVILIRAGVRRIPSCGAPWLRTHTHVSESQAQLPWCCMFKFAALHELLVLHVWMCARMHGT